MIRRSRPNLERLCVSIELSGSRRFASIDQTKIAFAPVQEVLRQFRLQISSQNGPESAGKFHRLRLRDKATGRFSSILRDSPRHF